MADESTQLIVAALHQIRDEARKTNERLDKTNERLDKTNERLDALSSEMRSGFDRLDKRIDETNQRLESLRAFTVQKLTDLNAKVDETNQRLSVTNERLSGLEGSHKLLVERFDNFLKGEGAKLAKRVEILEDQMRQVFTKLLPH